MTQEEKDLLLKDLCGRLPYEVKASYYGTEEECETWDEIEGITIDGYVDIGQYSLPIEGIKPYLFPLSSMTEEQKEEYLSLCIKNTSECTDLYEIIFPKDYYDTIESIDYLYKNHIDIRGLIPMGLAIDCTNLNIY